jgi:hypothetical protein
LQNFKKYFNREIKRENREKTQKKQKMKKQKKRNRKEKKNKKERKKQEKRPHLVGPYRAHRCAVRVQVPT